MDNSAALRNLTSHRPTSNRTSLTPRERALMGADNQTPIRFPWTDELEFRRRAVARWRGNETGLKDAMMRRLRD